jgi:hypothetical protein
MRPIARHSNSRKYQEQYFFQAFKQPKSTEEIYTVLALFALKGIVQKSSLTRYFS